MASLPYPRRPLNNSPTDFTDAHRWLGCVGFSHGIHGTHRNFWQRRVSHRFHRCTQMVRLHRLLWKDSLVAAWVWQDAIPSYSLLCLLCWCTSCSGKRQSRAETSAPLEIALLALLVQLRQLHPLERDSSKKVCGTITFLLLLHQIIRHNTLTYDRLNSIIVNK